MTDHAPRCRPPTLWDRIADLGWSVIGRIVGGITLLIASTVFIASGGHQLVVDWLLQLIRG
jgi:hypothetical protein